MKPYTWKCIAPILVVLLAFLAGCSGRENLVYRVTGLASEARVEYKGADGEMIEEDVRLPWTLEVAAGGDFEFQLYVMNSSGFGTVACDASLGERSLGDASGRVFAGCRGTVERGGGETSIRFDGFDDIAPDSRTLPAPGPLVPGTELIVARGGNVRDGLDLYLIDPSSSAMTKWTDGLFSVFCPQWSPDGEKVAFRKRAGNWDIYVMDVDGSNLLNLTDNKADEGCPTWAPDGNSLAFQSIDNSKQWNVIVVSADGRAQSLLTSSLRLSQPKANFTSPSWSPDGKQIAFTVGLSGTDIYLMDVETGKAAPLVVTPDQNEAFPLWSPDGQRLLFFRKDGMYIMNVDGSGLIKLDTGSLIPGSSDWSPDGTRIVFSATEESEEGTFLDTSLYLINTDGTGLAKFAELAGTGLTEPDWRSFIPGSLMLNLPILPVAPSHQP